MDSYLEKNFGYVKAKNSSEEELRRWRSACWLVKNRKRRFRYTANLSKRSEADAIRRAFKEVYKDSPVRPLNKKDSSAGDDEECFLIYFIRNLWEAYEVHEDSPVCPLIYFIRNLWEVYEVHKDSPLRAWIKKDSSDGDDEKEQSKNSSVDPLNKEDSSDGDDEKEVQEDSPVLPLNEGDSSDGDDKNLDSFFSISDEDEESDEDVESVGNTLSDNISEQLHHVSPNGSSRLRITSWQKGEELGRGSYGTVYEGISNDGSFFAVKEVSWSDPGRQGEERLLQLQQEISLLSQFEHENIVRYLGTDKDDKKLYVFLELMTKGSLATLYHIYELRDSQVSEFTRQILNGLKYLHDQKVIHRDIKCANILIDASGSVKLADFGLAKATEMNAAKTFTGSAFWMAPEVVNPKVRSFQSDGSYGSEVDIWSLGCTVLEMLTRQRPYPKLDIPRALYRIGKGKLPPVPQSLSSNARDFILKCLQKYPEDRPSAEELLDHPFVRKPPTTGFASPLFNDK